MSGVDRVVFGALADAAEEAFASLGTSYDQGKGDFLVVQDDYGFSEVHIILCVPLPVEQVVTALQDALKLHGRTWRYRVMPNVGLTWNDDRDLVISADSTWTEAQEA